MIRTSGISVMHTLIYITIYFRIVVKYSYFMLTAIVFESHKSNETSKERPELFFFIKILQASV